MKEFWNERYGQSEYAYGTEPNVFFKEQLEQLTQEDTILFPAEGEGRNAVYAATKGLEVTAFDMSEEAKNKALQLAGINKVEINYQTGTLEHLHLSENSFNAVVLVFAHFPTHLRASYHKQFIQLLKPGGLIILEGFSKEQVKHTSGGPKNPEMLFSLKEIENDFDVLETMLLEERVVELDEGLYHNGSASVIRFIGKKPLD